MMAKIYLITLFLFSGFSLISQDLCPDAYDLGMINCGDSESDTGDPGDTPDPADAVACMIGLDGTWYTFTTGDALQEFTISGTDYNLFEGSCGSLNYIDGCGNGIIVAADPTETYYILVNGDFTIDTPAAAPNDLCSDAIDVTGGGSGLDNFCSDSDFPLCGSDGNASVWYSYDIGNDLSAFEISVSGSIVDPVIGLFSSCGLLILEECSSTLVTDCLPAGTYYVQVGSDFGNNGTFDLSFTETAASVANDACDDAEDITPSSTCSAETVNGDSSGACPESSNFGSSCDFDVNPTVWFTFSTTSETVSIDLTDLSSNLELLLVEGSCGGPVSTCITGDTNIPVSGNETYYIAASLNTGGGSFDFDITMNEPPVNDACSDAIQFDDGIFNTCCGQIEGLDDCGGSETGVWYVNFVDGEGTIYNFNNVDMSGSIGIEIYEGDCSGLLLLNEPYCGGAGSYTFEIPNCGAETHYIHITSSNGGCGTFDLSATPITGCLFGESCGDGETIAPSTGAGEECVEGCNEFACDSDCGTGGVWFVVETDDLATEMSVVVNDIGGGNVDPIITIIQAECSGSVLVGCADVASGDIVETAVSGNQMYFIEVSSGGGGDPGEFELCVSTDESQVECSDGEIEPTRPEYPDADPYGPYCPGEVVNFCYDVSFTVDPIGQGNNCQWIQGIIPTVGGGWDLEAMPLDAQGPSGSWFWLDEGEVEYNAPSSILGIINTPYGLGLEFGPGTLTQGDILPGGWWSVSPGGGCANDGNPNTMWGLPASCGSTQDVEFCFDLMVGELDDIADCADADVTDLKVHIFTMADGQTGCWSNNSCSGDQPVTFNAQLDCTSLVFILAEDAELCSGGVLNIPLVTEDGSDVDIIVEVLEEGNTSGASDWEFPGGQGVIADQIENEGDDVEIVYYEAYANDPSSICEGPRTLIEVIVYPEIEIEGEDPYYLCYQMPQEVEPLVTGGDGGPYEYLWEDGSTDPSIELPLDPDLLPGEYEILLQVTDQFGCMKEELIEYEVIEPLYPEIINPYIGVCKDGIEDLPELILEFESAGTGPYEFLWQASPGGLDFENGDNDQNLIINEEESSARTYTIFGTVIDDYGCEYTTETELTVDNGPDLTLEVDECFGTAFLLSGYDGDGLMVNFQLFFDAEGDWIFDGTTILEAELVAQQFGDNISYLAEEYGTYLLLGVSTNGCVDFEELELPPVPLPDFEVLPNDTICAGTTITVNVLNNGDYVDYNWSNGEDGSSFTDTPLATTTYYLVAETADDCEIVDSLNVVVNPLPDVDFTGSTAICPGSQTVLTAIGDVGFAYLWNGPNGEMITEQTAIISTVGTWNLTIVSESGCLNSDSFLIEENAQLNPEISGANICTGDVIALDGGAGFDTYEWLDGSGNVIGNMQTLDVSAGGEYILNVLLGSGAGACSGSDTFFVEQFDPIEDALSAPSTNACNIDNGGLSTVVNLTVFELGISGQWFDENNLPVSDPANIDFTGEIPGAYVYTFTTDAAMAPCTDRSFPFEINIEDCNCPSVAINSPPDFCAEDNSFDLSLIRITNEPGVWSINPGSVSIDNDVLLVDENSVPDTYELTFTLTDPDLLPSCQRDSTVSFVVYRPLDAEFEPNVTVCNEDTGNGPDFLDLDDLVTSGDPGVWSAADASIIIDGDNVVSFAGLDIDEYRFFYFMEDPNSACPPVTRTIDIQVIDCSCPQLELNPLEDLCSTGGSLVLNDYLVNPESRAGSWSVTGPDDSALLAGSVFSDGRVAGEYEFTFTFTNPLGGNCINSVSQTLNIIDPPSASVEPEVFACNGTNITVYPTVLNFDDFVTGSSGSWMAPSEYNGGVIADETQVDFEGLNPGTYSFIYTTDSAINPCDNVSYVMEVIVRNCNCPVVDFIPPTPLCNDGPEADLNDYLPANAPEGSWSLVNGIPEIDLDGGTTFEVAGLEGFYLFQYTLDEVPQGCPDFGQILIEIVAPPEALFHNPEATVCNVESVQAELCVDLNDYIAGIDGSWTADPTYDGDASDISNICFDMEMPGEVIFFIFNTESGQVTCDERSYVTEFTVIDCNCPNLELLEAPDICTSEGFFDLKTLESVGIAEGTWSQVFTGVDTELDINDGVIDLSGAITGSYRFRFDPDEEPSMDCPQFSQIDINIYETVFAGTQTNEPTCLEFGTTVALEDYIEGSSGSLLEIYINDEPTFYIGNTFPWTADVEPGQYTVKYVFEGFVCPDDSIEVNLVVGPQLGAEVSDSPCADANQGSIIVTSIDTGMGLLYSIDGGQTWRTESEFENLEPGTYDVMVEDEFGCQWSIAGLVVEEPDVFEVNAGEDRQIDEGPGLINLEISSNLDPSQISNIVWTENGVEICNGSPDFCWSIDVDPENVAEYCAVVTDVNGCVSEDCVVLRERLVKDVYIPNIFTATQGTGDDRFFVQADQYVSSVDEFRIYDRWGNLVFDAVPGHAPNEKEYGWDGTRNGQFVQQGVYVYNIKITYTDGDEEVFVGDITFIKN